MITGVHALIYTPKSDDVRAFFRDTLGLKHVDAGRGWLIFALPPAELGVHPADEAATGDDANFHELYLMCDDIHATVKELEGKGVKFVRPVTDAGFGLVTAIEMPGGGELGLYEPRHPTALGLR
jgi:predicted enzyme related to lactoylglutathione lyase